MQVSAKRFWNQPLNKRASRALVLILVVGSIAVEGWLGRKRLFAHDHRYQFAFLMFVVCALILISLLRKFAEQVRGNQYAADINTIQIKLGIISFLAVALFGIFGDYTSSSLDAASVGCSIFTAAILAIWNGASTGNSASAEEPRSIRS